MSAIAPGRSTGAIVRLHSLTMVAEDDAVMVGRPDIGSYALFPEEGAQALRMLDAGLAVSGVADWYEQACGEPLDVADFLATLEDLQFIRAEGEDKAGMPPVRWRRLGRWAFSWQAWLCYLALIVTAAAMIVQQPSLRPTYQHIFFTQYLSLIPIVLAVVQLPSVLIHESFHALAGRRLGLPSVLRLGRRLFYVVAETRLDSLLSVPRRRRYLPFFAGMLADVVQISALTVLAAILDRPGIPAWCPRLCLAVAFTCVLRVIWQFMFYLETDLYYVVATALRCADLQNATRFYIKNRLRLLLRRPSRQPGLDWSDRDHAVARWYALLLLAGYGFSLFSLMWAAIPTLVRFSSLIIERFTGSGTPVAAILDATSFLALSSLQWGLVAYVAVRDRRARRASASIQGALS
ncbi:MAG TPA: hypothetical protein VGI74_20285 [Streptosporangiaceae bacterium]|jgi:hypothetical protein